VNSTDLTIDFRGVELSVRDFPRTLQGWVAFTIAFSGNVACRNKAAAMKVLLSQAEAIIEQVKTGEAPP